ncbi:MAG TPA: selenocysteine-specific translation elongation factor [Gemmatimonadales bacterium]|nr:selenocysteine-specific translation elongation factor [Gemmatimonadales bacterium]
MIIGTAGHIDHGKSALIESLTGRRMDRLPDERRRGITIDLNFAPLELGDGRLAGVVDVPGHEDLVRTMAAGASGFDLALLVIAADEGIMPQTEEHLLVLEHLGVPRGIPVITRIDLVDADWYALVAGEVAARLGASTVEWTAPMPVSSKTGDGIAALRSGIEAESRRVRPRPQDDLFRLPVDRVFSVPGIGTVAAGTSWSGSIAIGAEVRAHPGGARGRVRSIERHGRPEQGAEPGNRIALGIAGVDRSELARGAMLVGADAPWQPSAVLDVRVRLAPGTKPLTRRTRALLDHGTAEQGAWLMPRGAIAPGGEGVARAVLDAAVLARGGDRFVVRTGSPPRVVGGGEVLDPCPPVRAPWPAELAHLEPRERLLALAGRRRSGLPVALLPVVTGLPAREAIRLARSDPRLVRAGDAIVTTAMVEAAAERMDSALAAHHRRAPGEAGMPLETLRRAAGAPPHVGEAALVLGRARGRIEVAGALARTPGYRPRVAGGDRIVQATVAFIEQRGLAPPDIAEVGAALARADMAAILRVAAAAGELVAVERDRYYARRALDGFRCALEAVGAEGDITVAALRERLGLSRKFLIPLLEWSDREGLTVRIGDVRRFRGSSDTRSAAG